MSSSDLEAFIKEECTGEAVADFPRGLNDWDRLAATEAGILTNARDIMELEKYRVNDAKEQCFFV